MDQDGLESQQLELFDQPLIAEVIYQLTFNQAMRLFEEFRWGKKKVAKQTEKIRKILVCFFDGRMLHTISSIDVENMIAYFLKYEFEPGKTYGPSAVNKAHMTLTVMFNFYYKSKDHGWLGNHQVGELKLPKTNPGLLVKRLQEPARRRFITPLEFRAYYKIARQLGYLDIANAIVFGIWSALAPIDLFALNDNEVDESAWQIHVYRRHTKTDQNPRGSLQIVYLTEKMWALIDRQRRYRHPNEKRIFVIKNRRRKLAKIRKIALEKKYQDFSWRDLRKAGSGLLHKEGYDDQVRADILGHQDPRMTRAHYTPLGNPRARLATKHVEEAFK